MKILLIKDSEQVNLDKSDLPDYNIVETFFSYTKEQSIDIIDKISFDAIVIKVKNVADLAILKYIKENTKNTKIIVIPEKTTTDYGWLN
ncbi:MAG: hypothetical protein K9J13_10035 [Saprospiraceae bacterium]|nr:hypothetical protein [Saprospiraceae bacterium]